MDEVFDKNLDRTALEELTYLKGESWYFQVINMVDNGYAPHLSFPNIRFWKYDSSDLKFENRPVHCGLAPKWAYEWGNYAPYILKHYGLQKKVDRERKAKRYDRYDPAAVYKGRDYYDSLRADLTVFPFNEDMLHSKVEDEVKDLKIKERKRTKLMSEKNYYFKNKHGNIVPVPERHYEQTLKQQGMTLVSKAPVEAPKSVVEEAPVEETPTASVDTADVVDDTPETPELTCDTCGFPAKSKAGLTRHSKRHAE
jgi:hypothetical protein